ncbi:MAG: hypothetical protein QNJ38_10885 [Prochloraceae cyanobacterium]|nr:hypothetical protein [Prochloraceae cyanobacterium]
MITKNNLIDVDRIKSDIDKLSVEDRSILVKKILQSSELDFSIIYGCLFASEIGSCLQSSSDADLVQVFISLAQRVSQSNF